MKKLLFTASILFLSIHLHSQDKDFSLAKVGKQVMGAYIFVGSEPANEYDYIATIDVKWNQGNPDKSFVEIIERAKKKYPNFNAIIFKDYKFEKADLIKFRHLEISGGGFRIGDYAIYQEGKRPKYGEIVQLDNTKQKAGFKYLNDYGEEKLTTVPYTKLSMATKEQYNKLVEEQNIDLQKHQFEIGEKVIFIKDKKSKCGEVVAINSKAHEATIKYLGIYGEDKTTVEEYFDVEKTSEENYEEENRKCRKEALQYKFEVGEKVVWKKEMLLGMKNEAINAEIVSLNDLEHKATVRYLNKDNVEKQETVSYSNLSKVK